MIGIKKVSFNSIELSKKILGKVKFLIYRKTQATTWEVLINYNILKHNFFLKNIGSIDA
jgi:hypothetical protein